MDDWQDIREAVALMQRVEADYQMQRDQASVKLARAYEDALARGLPEDEVHRAIAEAFFPSPKT